MIDGHQQISGRTAALIILGIGAIVGLVALALNSFESYSTEAPKPAPAPPSGSPAAPVEAVAPPTNKTAKERAEAMTSALTGYEISDRSLLIKARDEYHAIATEDECLPEVRKAVALLIKREKAYQKNLDLASKLAGETARKLYADKLEKTLLDGSIEAEVTLTGGNKTTLLVHSFICGRVFFHKTFEEPEMLLPISKGGFKRITCTNGFDSLTLAVPEVPMDPPPNGLPSATAMPDCSGRRARAR